MFGGRSLDRSVAEYIVANHFDTDLTFKDGKIAISEEQWELIDQLKLNMFIDDGTGYLDLGKDNYFEISDKGELLALEDKTWLVASTDQENWQVVPYYFSHALTDGDDVTSYGRIPVLLNGEYANLLVVIDKDGKAEVTGAVFDYQDDADIIAKSVVQLGKDEELEKEYDEISFVFDYYDYDGNFQDNYVVGDPLKVTDQLYLGDFDLSEYKTLSLYEIRDIYQQSYYSTPME